MKIEKRKFCVLLSLIIAVAIANIGDVKAKTDSQCTLSGKVELEKHAKGTNAPSSIEILCGTDFSSDFNIGGIEENGEGLTCAAAEANCFSHLSGQVNLDLGGSYHCGNCSGGGGSFPCDMTFDSDPLTSENVSYGTCNCVLGQCTVTCWGKGTVHFDICCAGCNGNHPCD